MRLAYAPYMLKFKAPAGTSRGVLTEKPTYLLKVYDEKHPEIFGIGEASVFPGLSLEADGRYEYKIVELLANVALGRETDLSRYPSLLFGFEQALRDFASGGRGLYFDSPFVEGKERISINGLVWMGTVEEMLRRAEEKLNAGFRCIKLKIGALDWDSELELLRSLRNRFSPEELEIRVDANGGFPVGDALRRLRQLGELHIHSIEQPIPPGDPDAMAMLCAASPVPVALDESLIGMHSAAAKRMVLDYIHPAYIILKPSLCGGFAGSEEWISLATERGIGWWVTSALESNVGLNALAQWVGTLGVTLPQGLGTGQLFTNNFTCPLQLDGPLLSYNPSAPLDREQFAGLDWRE